MWVDIDVRCRKCPNCLRQRGWAWTNRAKAEIARSSRTWFGTLTLSPAQHDRVRLLATKRNAGRAVTWERLSQEEQFAERVREITPEITLWLKRIRKESGAKLRYVLVAEAHKSGLPHFHMLVHEQHGGGDVKHRMLTGQWKLGFSRFTVVQDNRAAVYVCKYLTKSALSRVRASVRYGTAA